MIDACNGPVVIGAREIYDAVQSLRTEVQGLVAGVQEQARRQDDQEARLRSLERRQWPLTSIAVLISVAAVILALLGIPTPG